MPTMTTWVETPLWDSPAMSAAAGAPVLLKMEAFQPAGSFKSRGMGAACLAALEAGARRVVCASGGNAGFAVACAARRLGLEAAIVVPSSTPEHPRRLIGGQGAEVLVHGESWDEAHEFAVAWATRQGAAYVHPFDDPRVWAGHATMIAEIIAAGVRPAAVVVSVGGGGLLCGVLEGLHAHGLGAVPVVAVETRGADSFASAVAAGRLVTLPRISSLATTLGARTVTPKALEWAARHPVRPVVVSDRDAVEACLRFADDHRVLVEPSCGAALSAVYTRAAPLEGSGPVVVIVCGGAGVTRALLEGWSRQVGL